MGQATIESLARRFIRSKELARRVRPYLVGGFFGPQLLLFQVAMAQTNSGNPSDADATTSAFNSLTSAICSVANAMRGPLGLAIVILMFAVGAISLMIGGRRAVPLMISAAIGGVILSAAPSFAQIFMTSSGGACQSTSTEKTEPQQPQNPQRPQRPQRPQNPQRPQRPQQPQQPQQPRR